MTGGPVVVLTMDGPLPQAALTRLLDLGVAVSGVVLARPAAAAGRGLPVEVRGAPPAIAALARARGVPVGYLSAAGEFPALSPGGAPDVILVTCFPRRLAAEVTRAARRACLNLHPSLLPRYRGPYPLFWQLRAGEADTGVSLHHVSERLDAGDLVAQRRVPLPEGGSPAAIEGLLGAAGAELLSAVLAHPGGRLPGAWPQDEARATRQGVPGPGDFEVPIAWSARQAFNFMRGTEEWRYPYTVVAGDHRWALREVIGWAPAGARARPCERLEDRVRLRFASGVLEAVPQGDWGC
jgi:methionyl-tRNA formyltransferase